MNSAFKLSLFAAALAFAVPNVVMAAPATTQHSNAHKYYKGHRHSKKVSHKHNRNAQGAYQSQGDQTTADLNARSLQVIQSVNNGQGGSVQQIVPNPENALPPSARVPLTGNQTTSTLNRDSLQDVNRYDNTMRPVQPVAPGTGNTMVPPPPPVAGSVNPNNMPPVQY
ncbi:hypothetical protein [Commensalibacter oyaizuii]|uniref:Uncharacterized protein n=1 Tax=Commensalibacter oyaizuii TaxID=3043873 RepID=A0ABT6PZG4_9PROT|nr:hypothetical protein [Commensalibacter sp. TBRC 16381]MDI2090248.1 hypothetical protein [Commensalibacter sp. TBRC 16381]